VLRLLCLLRGSLTLRDGLLSSGFSTRALHRCLLLRIHGYRRHEAEHDCGHDRQLLLPPRTSL
jgi:hypothetical protein